MAEYRRRRAYIPGFGHRFHPRDPRRDPLLALVREAIEAGEVPGRALEAGLALEAALAEGRERPVPMNIDGATAIIYAELGFPPQLGRGLFMCSPAAWASWPTPGRRPRAERASRGRFPGRCSPATTGRPNATSRVRVLSVLDRARGSRGAVDSRAL
ncbi:citrate/2-methylcitrate synthase [Streptomyces sp. NRRL F-5135]|uniref:citrate/2-methylcitrate synthase n=1 Tax=Streptomyces sp. NRRL F-5135 TaxID=1463858 RepID=UPI000AB262D2|nr:citrate/2-methylcitrate synthase [Streptomyces sp. NRRL F-5135]